MTTRFTQLAAAIALALIVTLNAPALAARPAAARLLPKGTVAYVRVSDTKDLSQRFDQTALGRMSKDPQLAPLVKSLYGSAVSAFATAEKQLDVSLDELMNVPQGEITFAVVSQQNKAPAIVLLADVGDHLAVAQKLIDRGTKALEERGANKTEEVIGDSKVTVYTVGGQVAAYAEKDGTIVAANSVDVIKGVLESWDGKSEESLAQNQKFVAIMKSCRASEDDSVQLRWFVDPIAVARGVTQGNSSAQIGLAILPAIGLDGLEGIGGSMSLAAGEFDVINHVHVLLSNPRSGVLEALALGAADSTPERWVPAEVASYGTITWDFEKTLGKAAQLVNSFQGEGALSRLIKQNGSNRLGADIEAEILPALEGRVSMYQMLEQPGSLNGQGTMVGLKLRDSKAFVAVLDKVVEKFSNQLTKKSFGANSYFQVNRQGGNDENARRAPCIAIVGDYLLMSDRASLLEKAIISTNDPSAKTLADAVEYKLIASKIARQSGGSKPGAVTFNRPEEGLRFWYSLAQADRSRQQLKTQAANNQFFGALNNALEANPLPPFEVLSRYLAPGGGVLVNDETGFHYTSFALKRN